MSISFDSTDFIMTKREENKKYQGNANDESIFFTGIHFVISHRTEKKEINKKRR